MKKKTVKGAKQASASDRVELIQSVTINLIILVAAVVSFIGAFHFFQPILESMFGLETCTFTGGDLQSPRGKDEACGFDKRQFVTGLSLLLIGKPTFAVFWKLSGRKLLFWR
jgi:hypothetical protein